MTPNDANEIFDSFERQAASIGCLSVWDVVRISILKNGIATGLAPDRAIELWRESYDKKVKP